MFVELEAKAEAETKIRRQFVAIGHITQIEPYSDGNRARVNLANHVSLIVEEPAAELAMRICGHSDVAPCYIDDEETA